MSHATMSWPARTYPKRPVTKDPIAAPAGKGSRSKPPSSTGGPTLTAVGAADPAGPDNRRPCPAGCPIAGSKLCERHRGYIDWAQRQIDETPRHRVPLEESITASEQVLEELNCPFDETTDSACFPEPSFRIPLTPAPEPGPEGAQQVESQNWLG